jgi:PAS domain S-box-containing protein
MAHERILVVDDEPGVVRSCVRILSREGYTVTGNTNSQSVPDLLRQETFDMLLTDIKMPRLDGMELLELSRAVDPHLTVVLITGFGTMEDAVRAIRLGASGFLMKPFDPGELIQTVEESLARRNMLRDSLHLQNMLPLLEINNILQVSGGEVPLVQQVLESTSRSTGAARLVWYSYQPPDDLQPAAVEPPPPEQHPVESLLPDEALNRVLAEEEPVWMLADGTLVDDEVGQPNIVAVALPLVVKGRVAGLLTAESSLTPDGTPFAPISLGLLSVVAGQLAIIIENVRLFQQTESLRAFNENIIQNMTNGLVAVNTNREVTAINPAAAELLAVTPETALQQSLPEILPNAGTLADIFNETLQSEQAQPRQEITVSRDNGEEVPVAVSTAPLSGVQAGVVAVLDDLSEIKALEAEHRRLDRLAALGEMSAVVAHEIRNPVAGISAGIDYLTRYLPQNTAEQRGVAMLKGEVTRINRILEDILFAARPMQLSFSRQPLKPIINAVIQRNQSQLEAGGVRLTATLPQTLPPLYLDAQRLEQVLDNLVNNAAQAMPDGGELTVAAFPTEAGEQPAEVIIQVIDTGAGIPPNVAARIFDPFFTTKTKGTGLGLAVARRIIEAHHGTLTVKESQPQGSSFVITLPVQEQIR